MPKQLLKKQPRPAQSLQVGEIQATLKRSSRRRRLTIRIEGGEVQVRAPTFATVAEIENFLRHKYDWVQEKLHLQRELLASCQRRWQSGERLPLLGAEIRLNIAPSSKADATLDGDTLHIALRRCPTPEATEQRVQALVQQWYRAFAQEHLARRVAYWQAQMDVRATGQSVKTYKARWGSCNHRAEICFNWKLIMAPPEVIDYVVVHELSHIVHFNHSPAFWRLVAAHQPHYKTHKAWLRRHGLALEL